MRGERPVECAQERATAAVEVLPGVLAVEDDGDERYAPVGTLGVATPRFDEPPDEVSGRGLGRPRRVGEADEVGECVIAEHAGDLVLPRPYTVRTVENLRLLQVTIPVARQRGTDTAREDQLVGRHPLQACIIRERNHRVRHRPFRWPEPTRRLAKDAGVVLDRPPQLLRGIFRVPEPLARHARVRVRAQEHVAIAEQRQNGMVEGGRRELYLTAGRRGGVLRNHLAQDLEFDLTQDGLVLFLEVAPLLNEPAHARIGLEVKRIHPGELVPHLQVADVADGELPGGDGGAAAVFALAEQLAVSRVGVDHAPPRCVEAVGDQEGALFVGQLLGRLEADLEMPVPGAAVRERFELHEEGRHEVEREAHVRKLAQQRRHPVVVLERMQADPRQDVLPCHQVLIERLVMVPQQRNACFHVLR